MTEPRRTFVMGDPKAPMAKVLAVLAAHAALGGGRLAEDVVLVSFGEHFDHNLEDPAGAGAEGLSLPAGLGQAAGPARARSAVSLLPAHVGC